MNKPDTTIQQPSLPASFFIKSRSKLKKLLLPSSVVILSSNRLYTRNGDLSYPYRQSSDLYYLTGIKQDNCTLVIYPGSSPDEYRELLFIPEADPRKTRWDGPRLSVEQAKEISGIEDILYNNVLNSELGRIMQDCRYTYFGTPANGNKYYPVSNEQEIRTELGGYFKHVEEHEFAPLMTRLRMYKQPEELELMRKAIEITGDAFIEILGALRPGAKEYEVAALMTYVFQRSASVFHAFDPIVASGENALILHYITNTGFCKDEDLLLLDFGADWEYYAADISRTIPVNGRFNKRQRDLYEANLRVMNMSISLMVPGKTLVEFNKEVGKLWEEEHVRLGLYSLADIRDQDENSPVWKRYYWHGTSHSIGIDVHDCFDHSERFKEGMVLSCEPGIYIPEEKTGIRLENDILITANGPVNLSEDIPIDPDAIELIMNK